MKKLNSYIKEAFKLGDGNFKSRNERGSVVLNEILSFLFTEPSDAEEDLKKALEDWVNRNNATHLTILSNVNSLEDYGFTDYDEQGIDDYLIPLYKNNKDATLVIDEKKFKEYYGKSQKSNNYMTWKDKYEHDFLYDYDDYLLFKFQWSGDGIIFLPK